MPGAGCYVLGAVLGASVLRAGCRAGCWVQVLGARCCVQVLRARCCVPLSGPRRHGSRRSTQHPAPARHAALSTAPSTGTALSTQHQHSTQHPAPSTQHPAPSTQHGTQHLAPSTQHDPFREARARPQGETGLLPRDDSTSAQTGDFSCNLRIPCGMVVATCAIALPIGVKPCVYDVPVFWSQIWRCSRCRRRRPPRNRA